MTCWYFDKKELRNTPSIQDGLTYETECRYRKEGAKFIIDMGSKMDLGYNTMATSVIYFHRFYIFHSFKTFPKYVTACCCLFLAGKVEVIINPLIMSLFYMDFNPFQETPKKCSAILKVARDLLGEEKFASSFGTDPKEEVMTLERILLQTIKFDLNIEHPYSYLLKYAKCLKGDKNKLQKMVQMAWTFCNDSLCTTLSLQWEPEIIAVALMYLAGKLSKCDIVDWTGKKNSHLRWWDMFVENIDLDLLEDICHQVLDLYAQANANSSKTLESPPSTPSNESFQEKHSTQPSAAATEPNAKVSKSVTTTVSSNGCQSADVPDKSMETSHFPAYSSNFPPANLSFPPVFPPANIITVPPPPYSSYPASSNYFPSGAPSVPPNSQRTYYPPP